MKKVTTLFLTVILLISTTACGNGADTNSRTTSEISEVSGNTSLSSSADSVTQLDSFGMPSWLYLGAGNSPNSVHGNQTDSIVVFGTRTGLYGYDWKKGGSDLIVFSVSDSGTQYTDINVKGEEIYGQSYEIFSSSDLDESPNYETEPSPAATISDLNFVPILPANDDSPSYTVPSSNEEFASSPVFIGEDIYYMIGGYSRGYIKKFDTKTKETSDVFNDESMSVLSFTYDKEYLYFQGMPYEEESSTTPMSMSPATTAAPASQSKASIKKLGLGDPSAFKTVYRVKLSDTTQVETFEYETPAILDFAVDGKLYASLISESVEYQSTDYVSGNWGEELQPIFSDLKDNRTISYFQPYSDGYVVLSTDSEETNYLSFYSADGVFEKELCDPVPSKTTEGFDQFMGFESYETGLFYYTTAWDDSDIDNIIGTQSSYYISPEEEVITLPTPPAASSSDE